MKVRWGYEGMRSPFQLQHQTVESNVFFPPLVALNNISFRFLSSRLFFSELLLLLLLLHLVSSFSRVLGCSCCSSWHNSRRVLKVGKEKAAVVGFLSFSFGMEKYSGRCKPDLVHGPYGNEIVRMSRSFYRLGFRFSSVGSVSSEIVYRS